MKKKLKTKPKSKVDFDEGLLKHWKKLSTKAKVVWLDQAWRLGKLRKF